MKTKLRVWPNPYSGYKWKVQVKHWWSPLWWTIGTSYSLYEAKKIVEELEKTE